MEAARVSIKFTISIGELTQRGTNVTNDVRAEALFQFSPNVDLGNLFELVVPRRLKHAHVKNTVGAIEEIVL